MQIITVLLYALSVIVSLLLIGLILIQPSKSGGMGAAFGGVGESVFGGQAGGHLTKATVIMTSVFFVLTLVLASLIGHGAKLTGQDSGVSAELLAGETPAAVAPATAPAEATLPAAPQK